MFLRSTVVLFSLAFRPPPFATGSECCRVATALRRKEVQMKNHTRDAACLSFLACFLTMMTLPAAAQKPHPDSPVVPYGFSSVRAYIQKTIADKQLPSVSVAVAKNGKIIWEQAFGWADREKMIPATPDTIYALASLTKPYTSTGVMELVEQHKIDLDHPINEYLGSAPLTAISGDASGATLRRVLAYLWPAHSLGQSLWQRGPDSTDRGYHSSLRRVGKSPRPILQLLKSRLWRYRLHHIACFTARLEGLHAGQSLSPPRAASHERWYRSGPRGLRRREI